MRDLQEMENEFIIKKLHMNLKCVLPQNKHLFIAFIMNSLKFTKWATNGSGKIPCITFRKGNFEESVNSR